MKWEFNWKESPIPESACPYCAAHMDRATSPDGHEPEPGNYSVCWQCASLLKFDDQLQMIAVLDEEIKFIEDQDPEFIRKLRIMQLGIREMDRRDKNG